MAAPNNNILKTFVPTTNIWDVQQLNSIKNLDPALKELLIRLYQNINRISLGLNEKDWGAYRTQETVNGQTWIPDARTTAQIQAGQVPNQGKQVYRKVVDCGALPNAGAKNVAHGITIGSLYRVTRLYGAATDPAAPSWIPLPFASPTLNQNIKLEVGGTNVTITTAINYSAYTQTYVVIEYTQT